MAHSFWGTRSGLAKVEKVEWGVCVCGMGGGVGSGGEG